MTPKEIRESAVLLLASDLAFEHPDAESALAWARRIENSVDNDPLWADGKHCGDCTQQPHTCSRCLLESYEDVARAIEEDGLTCAIPEWLELKERDEDRRQTALEETDRED